MFEALLERALVDRRQRMLGVGEIAAAIYNVNRDREKHPDPLTALDFVPDLKRELDLKSAKTVQSPDEMAEILTRILGVGPGKGRQVRPGDIILERK